MSPDDRKALESRKKKKESDLWEKPSPPVPFLLHLGLTARTHDIREFQATFPEEYSNYFVDRLDQLSISEYCSFMIIEWYVDISNMFTDPLVRELARLLARNRLWPKVLLQSYHVVLARLMLFQEYLAMF